MRIKTNRHQVCCDERHDGDDNGDIQGGDGDDDFADFLEVERLKVCFYFVQCTCIYFSANMEGETEVKPLIDILDIISYQNEHEQPGKPLGTQWFESMNKYSGLFLIALFVTPEFKVDPMSLFHRQNDFVFLDDSFKWEIEPC